MNPATTIPERMTQKEFAALIGRSEAMVAKHKAAGRLVMDGRLVCVQASIERIKAWTDPGRGGDRTEKPQPAAIDTGHAALAAERVRLLREQADRLAWQNAVARKEYAPIGLLADVLGMASSAVVDRIDQLEGVLRKAVPDLPDAAMKAVQTTIANARNEWVRATAEIVAEAIDAMVPADVQLADDSRETSTSGDPA